MKFANKAFTSLIALAIFGLWGSSLNAQVSMTDVTIQQGQTGDVELSWTDGGSGATGVSLTNISFSDETDLDNITVFVTDVFTGDEVICDGSPTTIAANTAVSCNATFTTVDLENTAGGSIGDISNYARFRIEVAPNAGAQTVTISGEWESFDNVGNTISAGNAVSAEITITEGPQPDLVFDPAPSLLTFSAETDQQDSQDVLVCNSASGEDGSEIDVTGVTVNTTDNSGGTFGESNNCTDPLTPGNCCTVTVTFNSQGGGDATSTGDLDITTSAGDGAWSLQGTSTDGPAAALSISPTSHDYGDVLAGDETASFTFTVSNTGESGSELRIDTIAPPAGDFTISGGTCDPGTTTLANGESCTTVLDFAPATDGPQNGDLVVGGTDTVNSTSLQATAAVQGNGVIEARFSSDPAPGTINMGVVPIGGTLDQTVTITNQGNAGLDVSCGSLQNDPDNVFTLDPDPADFTGIAPDASEQFTVSCTVPDQNTYTADLSCTSNDPNNGSFSYQFSCTARPLVIPTMQPWGLIVLTLLMLTVGGLSIRYFRV